MRISWLMEARKSLLATLARSASARARSACSRAYSAAALAWSSCASASLRSRSSASAIVCSEMSVLTPYHAVTAPAAPCVGTIRVRNGRNDPSLLRRGKTISNGSPVAMEPRQTARTRGSSIGSCTLCQPQPSISAGVVPVYSYQRRLYQTMDPSAPAIQQRVGMVSARARKSSSSIVIGNWLRSIAAGPSRQHERGTTSG